MDKFIPFIDVKTLPNGYSLEFEGMRQNGFMYFSPDKLLEGFMVHIGLEVTDQLNMDTVQDFLVTAMNWKENEKCVKEIESLQAKLKTAEKAKEMSDRRLNEERTKSETIINGLKRSLVKSKTFGEICKDVNSLLRNAGTRDRDEEDNV